jgi:hypothetical protein
MGGYNKGIVEIAVPFFASSGAEKGNARGCGILTSERAKKNR